jgi:hypothetical protein
MVHHQIKSRQADETALRNPRGSEPQKWAAKVGGSIRHEAGQMPGREDHD